MAKWIALDLLEYIVSFVKGNGFFLAGKLRTTV